jgi:hypothetical protein
MRELVGNDLRQEQQYAQDSDPKLNAEMLLGCWQGIGVLRFNEMSSAFSCLVCELRKSGSARDAKGTQRALRRPSTSFFDF